MILTMSDSYCSMSLLNSIFSINLFYFHLSAKYMLQQWLHKWSITTNTFSYSQNDWEFVTAHLILCSNKMTSIQQAVNSHGQNWLQPELKEFSRQIMLLSSLISSKMCKKKYFNIEGLSLMTMQVVFSTMLGQNLNSWLITKPFLFGKMTTYVDTCFMWSARRQAEVRLWQILLNWACWGWETSKHAGHEPLRSRTEGHC